MFLLPVRGLPQSGWWGRRRESRERDSKRERQMLTGSMLLCLTDWQTDDATLKLIELTLEDPQRGTGSRTAKCSREASAVHLFPHFSFVSSVCLSLSFSPSLLLSPLPLPPPLFHSLPACNLVCLLHLFAPQINPEIHKWQRAGTAKKRAVEGGEG